MNETVIFRFAAYSSPSKLSMGISPFRWLVVVELGGGLIQTQIQSESSQWEVHLLIRGKRWSEVWGKTQILCKKFLLLVQMLYITDSLHSNKEEPFQGTVHKI